MWLFSIDNMTWHYLTWFLTFMFSILLFGCSRKSRRSTTYERYGEDQAQEPSSDDPNYDETQDNVHTVQLKEDHMSNVRLLTPILTGGCNDENAAKEAANRHKSNQYFPKLEIQSRRITNDTPVEELRRLLDELPPHPPQRYRTGIREPSVAEREAKWRDTHISWHDIGIVFLIRNNDPCRSKDDVGGDTVDSQRILEDEDSKINSEMPLSENKMDKTPRMIPRSKRTTPGAPSSKRSVKEKERKLARTQEDTAGTMTDNKTSGLKYSDSVRSVNL